jgi:trimeric autotransporter adhesin
MRRLITTLVVALAVLAATCGKALADPVQSSIQGSSTDQTAAAASSATQIQPSNQNISVRVLSPGSDGSVTQSNDATSNADATNTATSTQSSSQTLAGGCGCAVPTVTSGNIGNVLGTAMQAAAPSTTPAAPAPATSQQSNDAASTGAATNTAPSTQTQTQSAPSGGSGVQSATQGSSTDQTAVAASSAKQVDPSNSNISVRVLSPGNDGNVTQSNNATSHADATNSATTTQSGSQTGGGGGVQSSKQDADTSQGALGLSSATQYNPSNSNTSVRVLSPGNGGSVSQSNTADSSAHATNTAPVSQTSTQTQSGSSCGCDGKGSAVQSGIQKSDVDQGAIAASSATQIHPSNSSESIRIGSWGNDGNVTQSNDATSTADATNTAPVTQTTTQTQGGSSCGCASGPAVQATGQTSDVGQLGVAASSAKQIGASNSSDPVRIWSPGNDGNVTQSNDATSHADATNTAPVKQTATQTQSGSGVQAVGQESKVGQGAIALSSALQAPGESRCGCGGSSFGNTADPVRIGSYGNGGSVTQSNDATSSADATNTATPTQTGTQTQSGSSCGCSSGPAVQAIGQESKVGQLGFAASSADQIGASNSADPVRVWSPGNDGSVKQSNDASSTADATNTATPTQTGTQTQSGSSCGCSGPAVQAIGQESKVGQLSAALSSAKQIGASNSADPVRVWSPGNGGSVMQSNDASSTADATNTAVPTQTGTQTQSGPGVQAIGQESKVGQAAFALSSALQAPGQSRCGCGGSSFGNSADPVRIGSYGNDGSVYQSNDATSTADATNTAAPSQTGTQTQAGSKCGCGGLGVQALGQESHVHQLAVGLSNALQGGAHNASDPIRIWSYGGGGWTKQSNDATSEGDGSNVARILQPGQQLLI